MSHHEEVATLLWTVLGFVGCPLKKCGTRMVCAALGWDYDQQIKEREAERTPECKLKYYESDQGRKSIGPRIWGSPDVALWTSLAQRLCDGVLISTKTKTVVTQSCPILSDLQSIVLRYLVCSHLDLVCTFMIFSDDYLKDYIDFQPFTSDDSALLAAAREIIREAVVLNLLVLQKPAYRNCDELQTALLARYKSLTTYDLRSTIERALSSVARCEVQHQLWCPPVL